MKSRFTLTIDSKLLQNLRIIAAEKGYTSLSDLIVYYIKVGLDKEERSN